MKKLTLVLNAVFFLGMGLVSVMADETAPNPGPAPGLGVEVGMNLANFNGQNANDVIGSRLGWVGGGFLSLPFGPTLALQPEVLYEQKGGKINGNSYQVDYVEVPILLDITLVGPLGILLGPSFAGKVFDNNLSDVNNSEVGLIGGAQLNLARFLVSGRYEVGLTDVSSNQKIQNGTFTLLVGLSFI
jgi:hypothetical protein